MRDPLDRRVGKRGIGEGFLEVVRAELQVQDSRGCGASMSRRERASVSCPGEVSMATLGIWGCQGSWGPRSFQKDLYSWLNNGPQNVPVLVPECVDVSPHVVKGTLKWEQVKAPRWG